MLTPTERLRVDAAGEGSYQALHRDSVAELMQDLKTNRATAVIVSVIRCDQNSRAGVAALVREFPQVPTVALLSQLDRSTPQTVLSLGATGVRRLIDVRDAEGWRLLRTYLGAVPGEDMHREALGRLALELNGVSSDCWRCFETLLATNTTVASIRELACRLEVVPSTLMSRFFRLRLPAPKRYLAMARLVNAARVFENPGFSVADVANHLDYSSPQSFGRHVKMLMGITAVQFRERFDGEKMLDHFRQSLVAPYTAELRELHPLTPTSRRRRRLHAPE
jgi:AraC-like DNA-binding protein